jgi:hypothetical protein
LAQQALPRVLARRGAADFRSAVGPPPGVPVVPPSPRMGGAPRSSRVPGPALRTCHGLRPRWVRGRLGPGLLGCGRPCGSAGRHPQVSVHHGAQALPACALRPISSRCTLPDRRSLRPRTTRYPGPSQGFRSRGLPPAGKAELCSALEQRRKTSERNALGRQASVDRALERCTAAGAGAGTNVASLQTFEHDLPLRCRGL